MGSLSDFAENEMVDHILGVGSYTTPGTVYLGLFVGDPLDTGAGGTEVSGNGYIRKAITFAAPASRAIAQNADVQFDEATGAWGTVDYWGIFTLESGGSMLAHGALAASRSVVSGNTPKISSGALTITFNAGKVSDYLAHAILNHLFRNTGLTQPSIYVALVETTEITDSLTGATIDELDMTSYAREAMTAGATDWDAAAGGISENLTLIDFGALTSTAETVVAACLTDNATKGAGNLLFYDNTPDQLISDGDSVQFPIGNFVVSLA